MFFRVMATTVAAGALAVTGAAAAQIAPASNVQLTGPQLESALLPASYFGAGYKFAPNNPWDSGNGLEHPVVKVHTSSYSCKQYALNEIPLSGFGETAIAAGQVFTGKVTDWTDSYYQQVYQFPSAAAAASFYRENYAITVRCETVRFTSGGKTTSETTQSLTTGHVDGGPAFFDLGKAEVTGFPATVGDTEWVLAGRDVYEVFAAYAAGQARLTPDAATLALIARVEATR